MIYFRGIYIRAANGGSEGSAEGVDLFEKAQLFGRTNWQKNKFWSRWHQILKSVRVFYKKFASFLKIDDFEA